MLEYRWNMLECEWNVLAYLSQAFLLCNLGHSTSQQPRRLYHIQNAQKSIAAILLAFRIDKRIALVLKNVLRRCMVFFVLCCIGRLHKMTNWTVCTPMMFDLCIRTIYLQSYTPWMREQQETQTSRVNLCVFPR